jgi:hypothetical protein
LALTEWKTAFQLGCQGPDFLFYDHYLPWQKSTALNQLGNLMHSVRCGPFLLSLFEETRDRSLDDPASAYALGFLLHHALDRNLHPFVFSRSGFRKWHHQRYETAMDSQLLLRRDGLHTGFTPVAPEIDTQGRLPGGLASGFLRIVAVHYPALAQNITADQLDGAVAQFQSAQRLFYDPSGWKGRLTFGQLAPFSPPRRTPEWDVLNEARQTWIDPSDRTVVHQASALELWDFALEDGRNLAAAVLAWKRAIANNDGAQDEARLKSRFGELLGDVSYETGLPCGTASIGFAESVVPS